MNEPPHASHPVPADRKSLFDRIGGRERILPLLHHFYADVRQHNTIGPIFNATVSDWPAHIANIADFWGTATGGPPTYRGAMPLKHLPLQLGQKHFDAWLDLWRRNCRIQLNTPEAEELIALAETIGRRLHTIVTYHGRSPGVPVSNG